MLSVETALPDVEELHKLVEQGQETACFKTIQLTLREYAALQPRRVDQPLLAPGHEQQPVDA